VIDSGEGLDRACRTARSPKRADEDIATWRTRLPRGERLRQGRTDEHRCGRWRPRRRPAQKEIRMETLPRAQRRDQFAPDKAAAADQQDAQRRDTGTVQASTTGIFPIRACHCFGPVVWTDSPVESTATVTGMSRTSNS
jgi:hypothetical protein